MADKKIEAKKASTVSAAAKTAPVKEAVAAKVEEKKVEVKAAVSVAPAKVAVPAKVEEKKVEAKSAPAPKKVAAPKKEAAPKKAAAPKKEVVAQVFLVEGDGEGEAKSNMDDLVARVKADYVGQGHRAGNIKSIEVYVKPEDQKVYYVINDVSGSIDLY